MTRMHRIVLATGGCLSLVLGMIGCAVEQPQAMSPNAVMETSGDKNLTWSAESAGNLTVYDQNTEKIVYGTTIRTGQNVAVDVDLNRVTLDSKVVSENTLHRGDQYRIFFEPTGTVEKTSTIETHVNSVETTNGK